MVWLGALVQAVVVTITLICLAFGTWHWTDHVPRREIPSGYSMLCYIAIGVAIVSWIIFGWTIALA